MTDDEGQGRDRGAVPDDVVESVREYVENRHDFLAWLDTSADDIAVGRVVLSVPYDEKLTNRPPDGPSRTAARATTPTGPTRSTAAWRPR